MINNLKSLILLKLTYYNRHYSKSNRQATYYKKLIHGCIMKHMYYLTLCHLIFFTFHTYIILSIYAIIICRHANPAKPGTFTYTFNPHFHYTFIMSLYFSLSIYNLIHIVVKKLFIVVYRHTLNPCGSSDVLSLCWLHS